MRFHSIVSIKVSSGLGCQEGAIWSSSSSRNTIRWCPRFIILGCSSRPGKLTFPSLDGSVSLHRFHRNLHQTSLQFHLLVLRSSAASCAPGQSAAPGRAENPRQASACQNTYPPSPSSTSPAAERAWQWLPHSIESCGYAGCLAA